jgi:hypothetical protein
VVAADDREVAVVQVRDPREVLADRVIQHRPFGPRAVERHRLDLVGVRVDQDAADVVTRIVGQHPQAAGGKIQFDQPAGVRVARVLKVERRTTPGEAHRLAVQAVVGIPLENRRPLAGLGLPHQEFEPAVWRRGGRPAHAERGIGDPRGDVASILGHQAHRPRREIEVIDVVDARVLLVHRDEEFVREVLVAIDDLHLDLRKRCEVADGHRIEVHGVQPPILVATHVLEIQEVPAVGGPEIRPDPSVAVVRDRPGVRSIEVAHPHVQHVVHRGEVRQLGAIRRNLRAGFRGIAEEHGAGNEPRQGRHGL